MNRFLATFLALLCASVAVSSACIAAEDGPATRQVLYGDLDLSTAAGLKALDRRIESALNHVCLDPYGPSPAGVVDTGCKRAGWRALRPQVAAAIAQQQPGQATALANLSIDVPISERRPAAHR